jgi:hypothetical protein
MNKICPAVSASAEYTGMNFRCKSDPDIAAKILHYKLFLPIIKESGTA